MRPRRSINATSHRQFHMLWTDHDQVVHGSIPFVTSRLSWITVKIPDSEYGMMQIIGSPADGAAYAAFDDVSWS